MKNIKKYIGLAIVALAAGMATTGCQDDFNAPGIHVPVATLQPNITIADLKAKYWNSDMNYIDTIRVAENGEHLVVAGRVITSDKSGNIYKKLCIQDKTGALILSINANSLYTSYRIGQEIVIDLTDMYIGKYSTNQQLGFPDYAAAYGWQATFMPLEFFKSHSQLNGLPEPSKIDTLTIDFADLGNGAEEQMKYQGQLVRFNNVYFSEGGQAAFCTAHKVNTNRYLRFPGNTTDSLCVKTSGYSNFWSNKLPAEAGDVVGILSSYNTSKNGIQWQLEIRSLDDLLNFGTPTLPKGTLENPYDITEAIEQVAADETKQAWYTGFIVGSVKAGENVESDESVIWGADAESKVTLMIGQTADTKSISESVVLALPQGSPLREFGNLNDNPDVYLKQIWVLATPGQLLGTNALTGNTGAANEWRIEGVTVPGSGDPVTEGNGSEESPYSASQVVAKGKDVSETGVWVSGYIVGYIPDKYLDGALFTVPATSATNILIADTPNETDYTKCVPVQLPIGNIRSALNLLDNSNNLGKQCSVYGNLTAYFGVAGVKETSNYKLDGASGGDTPSTGTGLYDQTFLASQGDWTLHNVTIPDALSYVWSQSASYGMKASAFASGAAYDTEAWLVSPLLNLASAQNPVLTFDHVCNYFTSVDVAKQQATLWVSVEGADWQQLTIPNYSTNSDWTFVNSGDISLAAYVGKKIKLGFKYVSTADKAGTWEIKNLSIAGSGSITATADSSFPGGGSGSGSGSGSETPNPPAGDTQSADLNTMTVSSSYKAEVTSTDGWVAKNVAIQQGGTTNSNPKFIFIGSEDTHAVCLNGKVSTPGSLTSPTLTGGIKQLNFNYGFAFAETKCKFTVNIKQNGAVVESKSVDLTSITQFEVYKFSWDVTVSGDFVIEIVNDCVGENTGNKERVSIWDLTWVK